MHIIAAQRSEKTAAVPRHWHDTRATFGAGTDHGLVLWRGLIRQLIALEALGVDTAGHGGLLLAEDKPRPILCGEPRVILRQAARAFSSCLRQF